uniref:DUF2344 domain-containing protein n=1 Tax=uncultured bacterium Ad_139_A06_contig2 TaxID=1489304 RepID=A0A0B4N1G0_9BACT|nr:putative uncharacterized protein [uncultured bacterium Ad_139_A06_contig2]
MNKLRMRFSKTGRAVYISHLDLMHTLQRAFSRAGFSLKYSEGYNPHPQISIALPLSVGMSSICEILDFRLNEDIDPADFPEKINSCLPEGICVLEVYEAEAKSSLIKWLEIEGEFEYDDRDPERILPGLEEFFRQESIPVMKKSKRGMTEADIRPMIRSISFSHKEDDIAVKALISATEPTLNPELLSGALTQLQPELAPDFASYRRIETYTADGQIFR